MSLLKHDVNTITHKENGNDNPIVTLDCGEVYSIFEQFNYCVGDVFKRTKQISFFKDGMYNLLNPNNNLIGI